MGIMAGVSSVVHVSLIPFFLSFPLSLYIQLVVIPLFLLYLFILFVSLSLFLSVSVLSVSLVSWRVEKICSYKFAYFV